MMDAKNVENLEHDQVSLNNLFFCTMAHKEDLQISVSISNDMCISICVGGTVQCLWSTHHILFILKTSIKNHNE